LKEKKAAKGAYDKGNALAVAAIVLCFMLTIALTGLLSGGGFLSALSWNGDGTTYYAVAGGCYGDITLAKEDARIVRGRGGAGFVLSRENLHHVLLNAYAQKSDAESVVRKQSDGAYIIEIYIPPYDYSWCKNGEREAAETALRAIHGAYSSLYQIGNSLDGGELSQADAKIKLTIEQGKLEAERAKFCAALSGNSENGVKLESGLISAASLISTLKNSASQPYSAAVRYTSISILIVLSGIC
jgi:hypothetical protein